MALNGTDWHGTPVGYTWEGDCRICSDIFRLKTAMLDSHVGIFLLDVRAACSCSHPIRLCHEALLLLEIPSFVVSWVEAANEHDKILELAAMDVLSHWLTG